VWGVSGGAKLTAAPEEGALKLIFGHLDEEGVPYVVLRNHEQLPYCSGGSDLDLLVSTRDGPRAKAIVLAALRAADGWPIGVAESPGFFKIVALGHAGDGCVGWWGLCIDVNAGLFFRGHRLLDDEKPLPVRLHNGVRVLSEGLAGVLGVLKEVLNNGVCPVKYFGSAQRAARNEWASVAGLLAPMGARSVTALRDLLLSTARPEELGFKCLKVRTAFLRDRLYMRPVSAVTAKVVTLCSKLRRYAHPPGMVMAVLGVDGAGKSTLINSLLPILNDATHNTVIVRHLRPGYLPPLARLKGSPTQSNGPVQEPHASTPSGMVGSVLRLTYLTLDYVLGYWLWTRPRIAKTPSVVVFDRYAYDMTFDPRRFRIGLPGWVARWFVMLAPTPDLIVCLHGSPEAIAARKQELPLEETRRQVKVLREFAGCEPHAVMVSTDITVEETRDQVLHALCEVLRIRSQTRF
jgi:thymidylate kinase